MFRSSLTSSQPLMGETVGSFSTFSTQQVTPHIGPPTRHQYQQYREERQWDGCVQEESQRLLDSLPVNVPALPHLPPQQLQHLPQPVQAPSLHLFLQFHRGGDEKHRGEIWEVSLSAPIHSKVSSEVKNILKNNKIGLSWSVSSGVGCFF